MADDYFVLEAERPLEPGQPWYHIRGLKTDLMSDMDMLPPTRASIRLGKLQWLIPNTRYNQGYISRFYPHFNILRQGEELTDADGVEILPNMPTPKDETPNKPEVQPTPKPEPELVPPSIGEEAPPLNVQGEVPQPIISDEPIEYRSMEPGTVDPNAVPEGPGSAEIFDRPVNPPQQEKQDQTLYSQPSDPMKVKQLKANIVAKLTELGETPPKSSTLKTLQQMLRDKLVE